MRQTDIMSWLGVEMKINLFDILMFAVLCWFVVVVTGCRFDQKKAHFKKQDGITVACARSVGQNCGQSLYDCDDGHEYKCVQNVEYY